ncbi:hypothetical protein FNF29_06948 [Cafeteria roenbergensis]|uniref:Uncharacterized protein n=1 Tax=Cafeteria roenbergensis TaxID=33653 RepID=A0A5A8C5K6_CAFRO|nr:hypothetical protein FNF29_06948 [Cafeteria roenbergensis]|eukprot:KAA0148004.1 hypothetical protein FNF29_06948 [Cafeteria roenbergensis]
MCRPRADEAKSVPSSVSDEWRAWVFPSHFTFGWLSPLLSLGYSRPLQESDLGELAFIDRAGNVASRLRHAIDSSSSMWWAMAHAFGGSMVYPVACKLVGDLLGFVQPLALSGIVRHIETGGAETLGGLGLGYWWAIAVLCSSVLQNVLLHQHHHWAIRAGMHARVSTSGVVFEKALRLSSGELAAAGGGQAQNLAQADSQRIMFIFYFGAYSVAVPIQVGIAVYLLWAQLGPASLVGLAIMLLNVPAQRIIGGMMGRNSASAMGRSDDRIAKTTELLGGVRVVKLFGLEFPFLSRIAAARDAEVTFLRRVAIINGSNASLTDAVPVVVAVLTFLTYSLTAAPGEELGVGQAFTSLAVFDILRLPLLVAPMLSDAIAGANVALTRLRSFLVRGDTEKYLRIEGVPTSEPSGRAAAEASAASSAAADDAVIVVTPGEFVWPVVAPVSGSSTDDATPPAAASSKSQAAPAAAAAATAASASGTGSDGEAGAEEAPGKVFDGLKIPSGLRLPKGLTAVCGSVGAGKSSLVAALTGEMSAAGEGGAKPTVTMRLPEAVASAVARQHERAAKAWEQGTFGMPGDIDEADPASAIAVVSQNPWLLGATVQDNITFGRAYDETRFRHVVEVCRLATDLEALPSGQHTEVGPSGNTTSGGQRARISLARAVYAEAPVVVLDDVLSAVDADVASKLFTDVIRTELADRTVVLVSQQMQYVMASDRVVVLDAGEVRPPVTPAELTAEVESAGRSHPLHSMFAAQDRAKTLMRAQAAEGDAAGRAGPGAAAGTAAKPEAGAEESTSQASSPVAADAADVSPAVGDDTSTAKGGEDGRGAPEAAAEARSGGGDGGSPAAPAKPGRVVDKDEGRIVEEEKRTTGAVSAAVYARYWSMLGTPSAMGVSIFLVLVTLARVATDFWLSIWSSNALGESVAFYVAIYAGISAAAIVSVLAYQCSWACGGVAASVRLHEGLMSRIIRAPIGWFDATPAGRIISRVSADLATVDKQLVQTSAQFLKTLLLVLATLITQAVVQPYVIIGFVVAFGYYAAVAGYFRVSSREIKRLDNATRAPVATHISQTIAGLSHGGLRAFGHQGRFLREVMSRLDANSRAFWKLNLVNRWLGIRLDLTGAIVVGTVAFAAVGTTGTASAGLSGLSLSFALLVVSQLNWLVRGFVDAEQFMASVERILEYTDDVPQEGPLAADDEEGKRVTLDAAAAADRDGDKDLAAVLRRRADVQAAPAGWPSSGALTVDGLVMRYNRKHTEPVLRGVSFKVESGQRIGIAGRTGGGKSSLLQCLFRTVEAEAGTICIDGQDISRLGLHTVRGALAIIPQDSVVFAASVRFNLAPGFEAGDPAAPSDEEMLKALSMARLADKVSSLGGLEATVGALSSGERQLLCIARAMLSKAPIVVLDEATASVDMHTDHLIQTVIREAFAGRTLLTVAHRLETIADYDKILVLVAGRVAEFDSPEALLRDPSSEYAQLVKRADEAGTAKDGASE